MTRILVPLLIALTGTTAAFAARAVAPRSSDAVRQMEGALGISPGGTRVLPQCGCTIRYLKTERVAPNTFAVYVQRLD